MTFEERVDFYMTVYGMSRADAERQARAEVRPADLVPVDSEEADRLRALLDDVE